MPEYRKTPISEAGLTIFQKVQEYGQIEKDHR